MEAKLIIDENGNQLPIRDIIKDTIKALEPEINYLNVGSSMDKIINQIDNNFCYYINQIDLYNKDKSFNDIIKKNISDLKK